MKQAFISFFLFSIITSDYYYVAEQEDSKGVPVEILDMASGIMNGRDPGGDAVVFYRDGDSEATGTDTYSNPATGTGSSGIEHDGEAYSDESYVTPDEDYGQTDYSSDRETQSEGDSSSRANPESAHRGTSENSNNNFSEGECKEGDIPTVKEFSTVIKQDSKKFGQGQCTEWVDGRTYQTKGVHAVFKGNAHEWNELAKVDPNWSVSNTPSVGSIMVFEQGAQKTSTTLGHVAFVESFSGDTVCTSNWNAPTLNVTTYINFQNEGQVSFISYVGGGNNDGEDSDRGHYN